MADTTTTIISVVLVIVMIVVTWLELRVMRSKSKARKKRIADRPEELRDEAHNALLTTRAIATSLAERGGIRNDEVESMLREAQMAYNRRNYRVALDLTRTVKDRLISMRAQQQVRGDLARLESMPSSPEAEEPTTKERLQKDYPPNMAPSKFAISLAESTITASEASGGDVTQARALLSAARSRFDAKDYNAALSVARQAERSAKGEPLAAASPAPVPAAVVSPDPTSTPPTPPTPASPEAAVAPGTACPSCGAPMKPGDAFCRKCGAQAVVLNCPNCGAALLADDAFCRKCGTRIPR